MLKILVALLFATSGWVRNGPLVTRRYPVLLFPVCLCLLHKKTAQLSVSTMLALKKKRETEAKQAAEAAAAAAAAEAQGKEGGEAEATQAESVEKVSLLGIGGKKKSKNGGGGPDGKVKKRTPGEIRIQKGTIFVLQELGGGGRTDSRPTHLHFYGKRFVVFRLTRSCSHDDVPMQ
jgi:hypothetical protein